MKAFVMSVCLFVPILGHSGGVSGGGGNISANPASIEDVSHEVQESRRFAWAYFNWLERRARPLRPDWTPLEHKLFSGSKTVVERLRSAQIQIEEKSPCYDPDGNPVDASASAAEPQLICISAARIVSKLSRDELRAQIRALLVHEFSHLVGTTEAEADQLQKRALSDLYRADDGELEGAIDEAFETMMYAFQPWRPEFLADLPNKSWKQIHQDLTLLWGEVGSLNPYLRTHGYLMYDQRQNIRNTAGFARFYMLVKGACAKVVPLEFDCQREVERVFQSDPEIDFKTYCDRSGHTVGIEGCHDVPGVRLRKLTDKAVLHQELLELKNFLVELNNYIYEMR